jgi:transposase
VQLKKGAQSLGRSRRGLTTKIYVLASGTHTRLYFRLSPGNASDAREERKLLRRKQMRKRVQIVMDKGYTDKKTRALIRRKRAVPVVPPKSNTKRSWNYSKPHYKRRNQIERLLHHLKNFRRIATRYDKLDIIFSLFTAFAFIILYLKYVNST